MERPQQQWWRFLALGVLTAALLSIAIKPEDPLSINWGLEHITLLAFVVGVPYELFDLRALASNFTWARVKRNLDRRLVDAYNGAMTSEQRDALEGPPLHAIFYELLDSNDSLKSKAVGVRWSGFRVTLLADIVVLSQVAAPACLALGFVTEKAAHFSWALGVAIAWAIFDSLLLPRSLEKHLQLSNEQVDFIVHVQRQKLRELIDSTLCNLCPTGALEAKGDGVQDSGRLQE